MSPPSETIASALQRLELAKKAFEAGEKGSTDAVVDAARAIVAAGEKPIAPTGSRDEKPSDFLQRVMWAEVSLYCCS